MMAAVEVSEAEKVYILHGIRVRFVNFYHLKFSLHLVLWVSKAALADFDVLLARYVSFC